VISMSNIRSAICAAVALGVVALTPAWVLAHCDSLDGPVVKAARKALATRDPTLVLIWVRENDEREIRQAFEQTLAVRELSPQAKTLADRFFFETLVRVHRAGEGEPFTGLKAAGRDLGPAIPAADNAIDAGSPDAVLQLLTGTIRERVREQFEKVAAARAFDSHDVAAGRAYVRSYVEFIHYVERLHEAAVTVPHGHAAESEGHPRQ
jgi:hypothetical protein